MVLASVGRTEPLSNRFMADVTIAGAYGRLQGMRQREESLANCMHGGGCHWE